MFSRQELLERRDSAQQNFDKVRLQATADINHARGQVDVYDGLLAEYDRRAAASSLGECGEGPAEEPQLLADDLGEGEGRNEQSR